MVEKISISLRNLNEQEWKHRDTEVIIVPMEVGGLTLLKASECQVGRPPSLDAFDQPYPLQEVNVENCK